ncbi:hypothetical protein OH799_13965 [Nocardia sp. NBC_00881]|nr:hypothetical protein OH799_13965 [Nocardia sp. NBC_00881]
MEIAAILEPGREGLIRMVVPGFDRQLGFIGEPRLQPILDLRE